MLVRGQLAVRADEPRHLRGHAGEVPDRAKAPLPAAVQEPLRRQRQRLRGKAGHEQAEEGLYLSGIHLRRLSFF